MASMSHPSPVKHARQITLPVDRQERHAIEVPPITSYPPAPSQVGHVTLRVLPHCKQPNVLLHRRCNPTGRNAGGGGGWRGDGCMSNGLVHRIAGECDAAPQDSPEEPTTDSPPPSIFRRSRAVHPFQNPKSGESEPDDLNGSAMFVSASRSYWPGWPATSRSDRYRYDSRPFHAGLAAETDR